MSSLRPSTHNHLYPLASTDPVQSSSILHLPQKPNKPEQLSPKAQKSPKIRKILTSKSSYFDISPKILVRAWINLMFWKALTSRSDSSHYWLHSTSSKYQKLSLKLTLPKILGSLQKNSHKIVKNAPIVPNFCAAGSIFQAEEPTCKIWSDLENFKNWVTLEPSIFDTFRIRSNSMITPTKNLQLTHFIALDYPTAYAWHPSTQKSRQKSIKVELWQKYRTLPKCAKIDKNVV